MTQATAATNKAPGFASHPGYRIEFERSPKRVRVRFNGEVLADSTNAWLLCETKHVPVYYFPRADLRLDLMTRTDHSTYCPFKGDASYWSVEVGGKSAENAVWSYETPFDEAFEMKDAMGFYWDKMDNWYEEDEEIFVHARDPQVRIDILASSRPVRVMLGGEVVAESTRARFLFETGMPTRYYLPKDDVRSDLLVFSEHKTACPYKGEASYYSLRIGERLYQDIVWFYPDPVPESAKIKDHLCFYNEKVDAIEV